MGQYQQPNLNLKGSDLELAQRNSQASVPFAVSSLGYGFLWNNPAVGRVVFGSNITTWEAYSTKVMDYWITAGETPAKILESYTRVRGLWESDRHSANDAGIRYGILAMQTPLSDTGRIAECGKGI